MLVIFQVMIQEDWTELMYAIWDAYTIWMWPYFILLNALGPMFAIQLFIVVVANKYQQVKHAQNEAENAATQLFEVKVGILSANIPRIAKDPTADPYVSVRVDDHVKDTRVIKNGGPAEWNEYYVFPVRSVASRAEISVKRWQRYGAHPSIAHISIPVGMLDTEVEGTDKWYEIESEGGDGEGTIHVRTQWRECDEDDWVDLPEVVDDDDDVEDEDAEDADLSA
jgi:Ca2+-dependent lipid-binding protein